MTAHRPVGLIWCLAVSLCVTVALPRRSEGQGVLVGEVREKTRVVLFDLEAEDIPPVALRILTDVVRGELVKSDRFEVIDRAHVQKVLEEQQFQLSEVVSEATMVHAGQIVGAEKIVAGRIGWLGKVRIITLQLIDVSTGRVDQLEASDFVGELEQMRRAVRAATQRLIGIGGYRDLAGGLLHVVSRPEGAAVYIDGLYEGTTPIQIRCDSAANYLVRVTKPRYQDWLRSVYVGDGETTFLEPALVSLIPSDIKMESTPAGANVYVYGKFQGTTPVNVHVDSAGVYDVQMTADNFHEWTETVHVRIGEDLAVHAQLVPIEAVSVSSSPSGGAVYIDDRYSGTTPMTSRVGAAGEYRVRIEKDEFRKWEQLVPVRPGQSPTVAATLSPIVVPSKYVRSGVATLWTFMTPYSISAMEATVYSIGVDSKRPYIGAVLVGAPLAYFGMIRYTAERDISQARTSMIVSSGFWGAAWGVMSAIAIRPEDESGAFFGSEFGRRAGAGLGVVASATAIGVAAYYTERTEISGRRVALINAGGFLGSVMGVGLPYLFNARSLSWYFGSLVAGGVAGAGYSIYATRGIDQREAEPAADREPSGTSGLLRGRNWGILSPTVMVGTSPPDRAGRPARDRADAVRWGARLFEYRF